jgi:hypothetical protein
MATDQEKELASEAADYVFNLFRKNTDDFKFTRLDESVVKLIIKDVLLLRKDPEFSDFSPDFFATYPTILSPLVRFIFIALANEDLRKEWHGNPDPVDCLMHLFKFHFISTIEMHIVEGDPVKKDSEQFAEQQVKQAMKEYDKMVQNKKRPH